MLCAAILDLIEVTLIDAQVEVISPTADYLAQLEEVFDFSLLSNFLSRPDFKFVFDALHAVTGAYAGPLFVEKLGADSSSLK